MKKLLVFICAAALAVSLCACGEAKAPSDTATTGGSQTTATTVQTTTENAEYTISYFVDGVPYGIYTYKVGDSVEKVGVPSKDGYDFLGWDVTIPEKMTRGNIIANALFSEKQRTAKR